MLVCLLTTNLKIVYRKPKNWYSFYRNFSLYVYSSLWEVVTVQEAVKLVRPERNAVLAAKKLQDTAQSYGCEENLSVLVLRFHSLNTEPDPFVRELRSTLRKAASQV